MFIRPNENKRMLESKQKGIITELQCITAFNQLGYHISIPYGENSRYDFIADISGKLIRVQVKTSRYKDELKNSIIFSCKSTRKSMSNTRTVRYTSEEIDYFCTYFNNKCYLIPIEECSTEKTLRFEPPANGQKIGITFAEEYELEKQIEKLKGGSN